MPYLIDGHNLIAKLPGIHLSDLDDEEGLVKRLMIFSARSNKKVEVFFDKAQPGQTRIQRFGSLTAHFISSHSTADQAIQRRLKQIGRTAPNWTVVSSDHLVQRYARQAGAKVISAEEFAVELQKTLNHNKIEKEGVINDEEMRQWFNLFGLEEGDE